MERRRFIPTSLGLELEHRQLLATSTSSLLGSLTGQTTAASNLPVNLAQRIDRVEHLPFFMEAFEPNRTIPVSVTAPIQDDLIALIGTIHSASPPVLNGFNRTIRSVEAHKTLSPLAAKSLVNAFDAVLKASGTDPGLEQKFNADSLALAKNDATNSEATIEAINDFGIISQLTQAIGQPFAAPASASLLSTDKIEKTNVTTNHEPHFIGTAAPLVTIQIVNYSNGEVIAQGPTDKNGAYSVQPTTPLPDGTYLVHTRTADSGFISLLSPVLKFRVFTPKPAVPKGPRG